MAMGRWQWRGGGAASAGVRPWLLEVMELIAVAAGAGRGKSQLEVNTRTGSRSSGSRQNPVACGVEWSGVDSLVHAVESSDDNSFGGQDGVGQQRPPSVTCAQLLIEYAHHNVRAV